jgi:hypothetical protein
VPDFGRATSIQNVPGEMCQTSAEPHLFRVSQEKCARLREGVPYVKVCRYAAVC